MNKCKCFRTIEKPRYIDRDGNSFYEVVGICRGTREMDECYCDGNELKCTFYPEVKQNAGKRITIDDAIAHFKYGISHGIFSEPVTTYAKMAIEALEKMKE